MSDKVSWNYANERLDRTVWNNETWAAHARIPLGLMNKTPGVPEPERTPDEPGLSRDEVKDILQEHQEADFALERPDTGWTRSTGGASGAGPGI